jgi:superfamily II DNA or RNA helicase
MLLTAPTSSPGRSSGPAPGQVVRCRTRTWLVESVEPSPHGTKVALACLDDDAQGDALEVIWELELDTEIVDREAWKAIGTKGFDDPRLFSAFVRTLRWHCVTATDPRLFQSPFRAGIRLDAYQLEPLRKALLLPRVNLFIADDVGLGKTIEAGLIASELLLRRRVKDIVVVCPPSMVPQWRDELETRFGLLFETLDRQAMERIRQERGWAVNPWATHPRWLVSSRLLIDETYAGPLRDWLGTLRPGALLIFDEAHHAAPSSDSRYAIDSRITRAIRDIAARFEHRLFLSATPHNGHSNSFSALLEILDSQRFTRGVKVRVKDLDPVMVRRLKEDIRKRVGGFPERVVRQIDIDGLPADAPELELPRLLDEYRQVRRRRVASSATRRQQAEAMLVVGGLQHRLLSSVEAFARTLAVHRRSMERVWAAGSTRRPATDQPALLAESTGTAAVSAPGGDDDRAELSPEELAALEDDSVAALTAATPASSDADADRERALLDALTALAENHRHRPDARIRALVAWLQKNCCPAIHVPGTPAPSGASPAWSSTRVLIFTEWEDTARYLQQMLSRAIAGTADTERRIAIYRGSTPADAREEIKKAFNADPATEPLRILIATDAAREGLNLQAWCHDLFHFDLPWNPGRLEQRNGRIDRKLQPAPQVRCHYFVHLQRPEDRVLKVLVEKTEKIRAQLGSLSQVLDTRIEKALAGGIERSRADEQAGEIDAADLDERAKSAIDEELEASRARPHKGESAKIDQQIELLRNRLNEAREAIGLDEDHLRDALSCALEMSGSKSLVGAPPAADAPAGSPDRFELSDIDTRLGRDPTWADTLDTLRKPPDGGPRDFRWRKEKPIRPVVFTAPPGIDDSVVQLHLEHRLVKRLLGRFLAQGFVYHDLSRACLAQSADAVPRVVLLGRLSLYGAGAVRLHEEILTVTARWIDPATRQAALKPYGRDAEAHTLSLLEDGMKPGANAGIPDVVAKKLLAAIPHDIEQLLTHLEARGEEHRAEAIALLEERGAAESDALRTVLVDQKARIQKELATADDPQKTFGGDFNDDEKRQRDLDRRAWQRFLDRVDDDIAREPERIVDFYRVASSRLEPIGIAYLWPVTN